MLEIKVAIFVFYCFYLVVGVMTKAISYPLS